MADTLALRALLERSSLRPGTRGEVHLLVDVTATGAPVDAVRPALSVVFVLDASGSMGGEPLAQVVASVSMLVDLLAPEDKVGVVSFSTQAAEVCALQPLTPEARRVVKKRTASIRALEATNIEAGLRKARAMLGARTPHERQVILLLSDGAPNAGAATPDALARVAEEMRADVSVSTLGYGAGHNADVLHAVAHAGGGQYWFVPDPQEASLEFARALGAQGDIVADNIELVLSPADACEVKELLGQRVRFGKSGPVTALPDLRDGQKRLVVAALDVTAPREPGPLDVATATVRYRAAGSAEKHEVQARVVVDVVDREPSLVVEAHHAALMARAEMVRAQARGAADRNNFDQAAAILRKMIGALEGAPGYVAADGSPLSECVEQLVDEAVEYEQRPSLERYRAFRATQLGVEVSQGSVHAQDFKGASPRSAAIMAAATGPALPGALVVRDSAGNVIDRVPVAHELTVGRVPGNDIVLASGGISKRHTRFCCRDGKLIVVDLKATNGTSVNGQRIQAPRVLNKGDIVQLGGFTIERVDEDP